MFPQSESWVHQIHMTHRRCLQLRRGLGFTGGFLLRIRQISHVSSIQDRQNAHQQLCMIDPVNAFVRLPRQS